MNIFELMKLIQSTDKAMELFRRIRWLNGIVCNKCGTYNSVHKHGKTGLGYLKYKCTCGHVFSDTTGTFMHGKKIKITYLLFAMYELSQTKSITSTELGVKLGIRQKKAWHILNLLRTHCKDLMKPYYELMMRGVIETDEAHFGKGSNSQMVHGILQRGQHAIILPIEDRTEETLKGNLVKYVKKHSYIMTDLAKAYGSLSCFGYTHFTLNHSIEEFSKGNGIHGNTMEGLWGNQKKILYGIHHGVSRKNLFKYISEFLLKFNLRQANSTFPTFLHLFFNPPLTC